MKKGASSPSRPSSPASLIPLGRSASSDSGISPRSSHRSRLWRRMRASDSDTAGSSLWMYNSSDPRAMPLHSWSSAHDAR